MNDSCNQLHYETAFHDKLKSIVRGAGDILLKHFRKPGLEKHYKDGQGFATQADLESEKYLISKLKELLPGSSICAEESGLEGDSDYRWVIDPLDGTTNFASGLPMFCVSVALTEKDKPVIGAIYAPIFDEFFFAVAGHGAFCNDSKITLRKIQSLKDAIVSFAIAEYGRVGRAEVVECLYALNKKSFAMRRFGALALDLAYCACGRIDSIVSRGYKWWDVAAGIILIQEAGGFVVGQGGSTLTVDDSLCVAGCKSICDEVLQALPSF